MHYYPHHIGDFIRDTANLSDSQAMAYLRMLWKYYTDESPLVGSCDRIAFAVRSDERTVELILGHYFTETPDGWRHSRCDGVISAFYAKSEKAAASAHARWKHANASKSNANALRTDSERNANEPKNDATQYPIPNTQEKIKNNSSADAEPVVHSDMSVKQPSPPAELVREPDNSSQDPPKKSKRATNPKAFTAEGLDFKSWPSEASPNVLTEWLALRKRKKAEVTQLVVDQFGEVLRQAAVIGWTVDEALSKAVMRGWQGLEIDWLPPKAGGIAPQSRPASKQMQGLEAIFNAGKNYGMDGTGSSKGLGKAVHALPRIHARIGNDRGDDSGMDRRDPIEGDLV